MDQETKNVVGYALMTVITVGAIVTLIFMEPMVQNPSYHNFSDQKDWWLIPNVGNTLSIFPFLIVGLLAIYHLQIKNDLKIVEELRTAYLLLFGGVALVAFGAAYYHLSPNNDSLVWDRLPMVVAFMALFSIVVGEFISIRWAKAMLWPAVVAGIASVVYWHFGEARGEGDLRFYALVQFLPMLIMPVIFVLFDSKFTGTRAYWWLLVAYILAKICEKFDAEIFELMGFISGHSIKHLLAAAGLYLLLKSYQQRSMKG
jgi:hypothetical protein